MSDRKSSGQMTTGQKIQQFKDYYLGGTIAVLAVAALIKLRTFRYDSDVIADDAQQNGEMASGEYPFGLSLNGSSLWNSMTADSAVKAEKPVLGVILESENDSNIEGLIRVLMK